MAVTHYLYGVCFTRSLGNYMVSYVCHIINHLHQYIMKGEIHWGVFFCC